MTESEQRIHDMPDRDLLIKTATNTENLCTQFEKFEKKNSQDHKTLFSLLDKKVQIWVVVLIIGALLSLTVYTGEIKNDVIKTAICVEKIENRLDASPW